MTGSWNVFLLYVSYKGAMRHTGLFQAGYTGLTLPLWPRDKSGISGSAVEGWRSAAPRGIYLLPSQVTGFCIILSRIGYCPMQVAAQKTMGNGLLREKRNTKN